MYKYYYLYQITNKLNGKIYIGVHRTNNLDDGYMGSGVAIKNAIKKYDIENFEKTILEHFDSEEKMFQKEIELVDADFVLRDDTYNLTGGGFGTFTKEATIKGAKKAGSNNIKLNRGIFSDNGKEKIQIYLMSEKNLDGLRKQSVGSEVINKKKEAFARIKHQQGLKNSQYGTMWITNGIDSKKIGKEELIPDGWRKGRIQKMK